MEAIEKFQRGEVDYLLATDLVARGLDINGVKSVLNFQFPTEPKRYLHRIGRTARAASLGTAFTLVGQKEQSKFAQIEELLGAPVLKGVVPAEFGETPIYNPKKGISVKRKFFKRKS